MIDATKERLHELVDALPPGKVGAANKYLESLVSDDDAFLEALRNAPEDDEPLTEEEAESIRRGIAYFESGGKGIPMEEILAEFGLTMEDLHDTADKR